MTAERPRRGADPISRHRTAEPAAARILSMVGRVVAATAGPWGYLRLSRAICAPDASEVAQCLHDPDAVLIAHARADVQWLLDQLQAERSVRRASQVRLDRLVAEIGVANQRLNTLPWESDGLHSFFARGLDRDRARWVGQVIEEVASTLDPETLWLKDNRP